MTLTLPTRRDGSAPLELDLTGKHSLVIIGANGAGKTRFTASIIESLGPRAFRLCALDALYNRAGERPATATSLETFLQQLMHDEMINLINYKLALADHQQAALSPTRLDRVIELWQEVFPGNRVLIDSGRILFARGMEQDRYSAFRLSDGERAVLYYAAAVLYAPENALIFVDSPEIFLHPTITLSLWNRLEAVRPDCVF
ncbi:MAG: ATP-binding protein, partial [Muribaculaceae bacterium]|nr:ATP-binding protein [Muribaculaceae bacterium]